MHQYPGQTRLLVAVDCIVFGFDGITIKLLLVKRSLEPKKGTWSLMGGFVQPDESPHQAAIRVLELKTGLKDIWLDQLQLFGDPARDPLERTMSIPFCALIDIDKYNEQLNDEYEAEWFSLTAIPELVFDHGDMVRAAKKHLRYKAALHPILFNLLPDRFTIPQLQMLYEGVFQTEFDDRNFSRKVLSTKLLVKQPEKDKLTSKKGAFYYKLDEQAYKDNFEAFLNFVPNPQKLLTENL